MIFKLNALIGSALSEVYHFVADLLLLLSTSMSQQQHINGLGWIWQCRTGTNQLRADLQATELYKHH